MGRPGTLRKLKVAGQEAIAAGAGRRQVRRRCPASRFQARDAQVVLGFPVPLALRRQPFQIVKLPPLASAHPDLEGVAAPARRTRPLPPQRRRRHGRRVQPPWRTPLPKSTRCAGNRSRAQREWPYRLSLSKRAAQSIHHGVHDSCRNFNRLPGPWILFVSGDLGIRLDDPPRHRCPLIPQAGKSDLVRPPIPGILRQACIRIKLVPRSMPSCMLAANGRGSRAGSAARRPSGRARE